MQLVRCHRNFQLVRCHRNFGATWSAESWSGVGGERRYSSRQKTVFGDSRSFRTFSHEARASSSSIASESLSCRCCQADHQRKSMLPRSADRTIPHRSRTRLISSDLVPGPSACRPVPGSASGSTLIVSLARVASTVTLTALGPAGALNSSVHWADVTGLLQLWMKHAAGPAGTPQRAHPAPRVLRSGWRLRQADSSPCRACYTSICRSSR